MSTTASEEARMSFDEVPLENRRASRVADLDSPQTSSILVRRASSSTDSGAKGPGGNAPYIPGLSP
eukprot:4511629-Pyramimonas_sp.AAC.1